MSQTKLCSRGDPVVLSYHDSLLRQSDVNLLSGPHWLNDSVVGFFLEHLQHVVHGDRDDVLFVSPEVTQCVKMAGCREEAAVFLDPLGFAEKSFAFFPLNDCERNEAGGSHWSLLAVSRPEKRILHFDSLRGANRGEARRLAAVLQPFLRPKISQLGEADEPMSFQLAEIECRQQDNGFDCGVFTLCHAELAALASRQGAISATRTLDQASVKNKRQALLSLIDVLAAS